MTSASAHKSQSQIYKQRNCQLCLTDGSQWQTCRFPSPSKVKFCLGVLWIVFPYKWLNGLKIKSSISYGTLCLGRKHCALGCGFLRCKLTFRFFIIFPESSRDAESCCSSMSQFGHCPMDGLAIFFSFDTPSVQHWSGRLTLWVKRRTRDSPALPLEGPEARCFAFQVMVTSIFWQTRDHIFLFLFLQVLTRSTQSFKTNCQWLRKFIYSPLTWGCIS